MEKTTAQGGRFSGKRRVAGDYSHNDFRGKKTVLEVGGARLFEAPQSGVWKKPRFPDTTDGDANCDDNAYCDSGVYYTSGKRPKPSNTDSARYEPNTSRQRKSHSQQGRPHASSAEMAQGRTESTGSVRKPKRDWEELWGLSQVLIFEAIKLVLILSSTIIRIGTALTESANQWLDEGMPRAPEFGHKEDWRDFTGPKKESTSCTGCIKLTDDIIGLTDSEEPVQTRKQLRTSARSSTDKREDWLQPQGPSENMAATASTPASSTGSSDPLQQTVTMPAMFYMPMPRPGSYGSPLFEGSNVSEFFRRY